ncbi:MAG: SusC/RagA family TonB-linked outer membrane protein [Flavobacteriaceae bacterium]|nr:MAG: SusC/RagA family TonB-linked outer membrane protein [Flavobacteriaceae bacterium]
MAFMGTKAHAFSYDMSIESVKTEFLQETITGTVLDENDVPLIGVTIIEKGTTNGTTTDFDGNYSITVSSSTSVLVFSYIGYKSIEIATDTQTVINTVLVEDTARLDEVVVVGYGTQKKLTISGAVTSVRGAVLETAPVIDVSNALAGRLPGVVIIQESGEPGFDGATISIRGTNTLGDNSPLIVIDGIPDRDGGLGRLNSSDIESFTVLKDASAAIYGARAANGAIIVTTKKGKRGSKPVIKYEANFGMNQPTKLPSMSNAVQYANIMNELPIYSNIPVGEWQAASDAIRNNGSYASPTVGVGALNANFSPAAIQAHADGSDPWGFPDTDWFGDTFNNWTGQSRHNLSISGGNDDIRYFTSMGYVDQDAYYKNSATRFQKYNFRVNVSAKINKYIDVDLGTYLGREERDFPTQTSGQIFRMLMRGRPTDPAIWPNGLPGPDIENGQNPVVVTTNATGYDKTPTEYTQLNGSLNITNPWIEGLKLTLSASVDRSTQTGKKWETPWTLYSWDRESYESDGVTPLLDGAIRSNFTDARLTQTHSSVMNVNLTALLNYDRTFSEDHTINVLVGATKEKFKGNNFLAFRRNYLSTAVDNLFAGGSLQQNTDGSAYERARLGYYGRFRYDFQEKYLAEFIWRYDGSYIFPENDRFGFFPGVLLGWNISKEDFFNIDVIDHLKLRTSYGQMGNDQVVFNDQLQEYAYLSTYGFSEYPINGVVATTLQETLLSNSSFTWEVANNFNVGIDAVINSNFNLALDYFYNQRDQILIQKTGSTPASSGISALLPPVNAGKVDNSGFEFAFNYYGGKPDGLKFDFGINGGYAKNKVVFMDEIPGAPDYQLQEGKSIGGYLVYESDGAFFDQAEIDSNTLDYSGVTSQLIPGDMKFKDINGDGVIDADDRTRLNDNGIPTFNFGATANFNYKNWDLNILFQGATGSSIHIETESGDIGNYLEYSYNNRWSIDNPSSVHPRLASRGDTYYTGGNFGDNTYYLYSKNYIRLKNLSIGYNFPSKIIESLGIAGIRVYASGSNLITWDKNNIFDPEATAQNGVYYPQARVLNTGFTITF